MRHMGPVGPMMAALALSCGAAPTNDGLFATIETSMGDITVELEYAEAPRTVANFVSLAEGTRAWINYEKAHASYEPFYDGITFHRVVSNFVIQAGSKNGLGTDGPGYTFSDEFHSSLTHSNAGILSMANSGPDSNGSQFFITLTNTPWLDGLHSVFGHITEGMDVVTNIGAVGVNTNTSKPLVDVVINSMTVTRNGAGASNFNPNAVSPYLPVVSDKESSIGLQGTQYAVWWSQRANCEYTVFWATILAGLPTWTWGTLSAGGFYITDWMNASAQYNFATVEVEYFE